MKKSFIKILFLSGAVLSAASIIAQATPGNGGANPGTSNGGSGIQTQPNPTANTNASGASGSEKATSGTMANGKKMSVNTKNYSGNNEKKEIRKANTTKTAPDGEPHSNGTGN